MSSDCGEKWKVYSCRHRNNIKAPHRKTLDQQLQPCFCEAKVLSSNWLYNFYQKNKFCSLDWKHTFFLKCCLATMLNLKVSEKRMKTFFSNQLTLTCSTWLWIILFLSYPLLISQNPHCFILFDLYIDLSVKMFGTSAQPHWQPCMAATIH